MHVLHVLLDRLPAVIGVYKEYLNVKTHNSLFKGIGGIGEGTGLLRKWILMHLSISFKIILNAVLTISYIANVNLEDHNLAG